MSGEFGVTATAPSGAIGLWAGTLSNIPSGWVVCDGNNGTPNLLDRFVQGVPNSSTDPGSTGGANNKTLSVSQIPSHTHSHDSTTSTDGSHSHDVDAFADSSGKINDTESLSNANSGTENHTSSDGSHTHNSGISNTGGGSSYDNRPPFYEIAFIMKS